MEVKFKRMEYAKGVELPKYESEEAAGMDLRSSESVSIPSGSRAIVKTGLQMELPIGYEGQIRPRSGLAAKYGITVLNSPGTIDSDYRGELMVILYNTSNETFEVSSGDRIAQMVISPVIQAKVVEVDELGNTSRGDGKFGSTGVN